MRRRAKASLERYSTGYSSIRERFSTALRRPTERGELAPHRDGPTVTQHFRCADTGPGCENADLSEDEAMDLAVEEVRDVRRSRRSD